MTNYLADIGLEVHVELSTRSKMFCSCEVVDNTQAQPNSAVCPVCCGMPGTLPVINRNAVELAIKTALALGCDIANTSIFARKNYFYPDLPKGYQISQYEKPLAVNGRICVRTSSGEKVIRIHRVHLEEDTGKLIHINRDSEIFSLVNLNRAGVPLMEIVSEPDMHNVEEVAAYSRELRLLLRSIGVSSGDMEKGTMRFEANLSMRPPGSKELGTRVEIKNLNSFRAMENAIAYQMDVQQDILRAGKKVHQQTLGWNEDLNQTFSQRGKEDANDYRYFPEPDLPPLVVSEEWILQVKQSLPELPDEKRKRYTRELDLHPADIERLIEDVSTIQFFEESLDSAPALSPSSIANWLLTDLFAWVNQHAIDISEISISPRQFTDLINLVQSGAINQNTGKEVLDNMLITGKDAQQIVQEKRLEQMSDADQLGSIIETVLADNETEVVDFLNGKETILNWLFGQVMKAAEGKANPKIVKEILQKKLERLND